MARKKILKYVQQTMLDYPRNLIRYLYGESFYYSDEDINGLGSYLSKHLKAKRYRIIYDIFQDGLSLEDMASKNGIKLSTANQYFSEAIWSAKYHCSHYFSQDVKQITNHDVFYDELNSYFSVRVVNCLHRSGVVDTFDPKKSLAENLLLLSPKEMFKVRNFGRKSFNEIVRYLKARGYSFWSDGTPMVPFECKPFEHEDIEHLKVKIQKVEGRLNRLKQKLIELEGA